MVALNSFTKTPETDGMIIHYANSQIFCRDAALKPLYTFDRKAKILRQYFEHLPTVPEKCGRATPLLLVRRIDEGLDSFYLRCCGGFQAFLNYVNQGDYSKTLMVEP